MRSLGEVLLTTGLVETWEGFPMKFCLRLD